MTVSRATRVTALVAGAVTLLSALSFAVFGFNAGSLAVVVVAGPVLFVASAVALFQWGNTPARSRRIATGFGWCAVVAGAGQLAVGVARFPTTAVFVDAVFALGAGALSVAMGVTWLRASRHIVKQVADGDTQPPA
ncbi:hypothetical protein ACFFGH_20520 [Lysobacter korlensis]|uniref:Transmembrane protein n=1 Tax=Lysobacter korlensis TaxID=553636 RepID=A0ABV6RTB8_9GAMM